MSRRVNWSRRKQRPSLNLRVNTSHGRQDTQSLIFLNCDSHRISLAKSPRRSWGSHSSSASMMKKLFTLDTELRRASICFSSPRLHAPLTVADCHRDPQTCLMAPVLIGLCTLRQAEQGRVQYTAQQTFDRLLHRRTKYPKEVVGAQQNCRISPCLQYHGSLNVGSKHLPMQGVSRFTQFERGSLAHMKVDLPEPGLPVTQNKPWSSCCSQDRKFMSTVL